MYLEREFERVKAEAYRPYFLVKRKVILSMVMLTKDIESCWVRMQSDSADAQKHTLHSHA